MRSLTLLRKARVSTGSIVLLGRPGGGQCAPLDEVIAPRRHKARVFAVRRLHTRTIADRTGGTYGGSFGG